MKTGSLPRPEDDDYASAAESLLGIDLSSSNLPSEPIDLDDADLFGEPEVAESPVAAVDGPISELAAVAEFSDDAFGGDFGAGLVDDAPPPPRAAAPARKPAPVKKPERVAEAKPISEAKPVAEAKPFAEPAAAAESEPAEETAPPARKDDSFWDALEGWDWGEDTGTGESKPAPRGGRGRSSDRSSRGRSGSSERSGTSERSGSSERSGDRSSRRSHEPPPSRPQRPARPAAESFGDEFGSGLDEERPAPRSVEPEPDVSTFALRPGESQHRPKGRREDAPAPDVSTFPLNPTESQVRSLGDDFAERPVRSSASPPPVFDEGDDFGAGLVEPASGPRRYDEETGRPASSEAAAEGEQRRGRRRRGGRGRGPERSRTEETRAPVQARRDELPLPVDDDFGDALEETRLEETPPEPEVLESRFADVPTWAEAISLLVKARPRSGDSGGSRGRSESSGESSERSGGGGDRGGRGRGRRGGGRRRSE